MKMCDECGINPANIHLTQIMQNESHAFHLCEECAKKKGINISVSEDGNQEGQTFQFESADPENDKSCSVCGMKISEFRTKGWLGCPSCYHSFEQEINELLIQVHGSAVHKGKSYVKSLEKDGVSGQLKRLRGELAQAIKDEEFEQAAMIRDAIHNLKQSGV
jgi:protein arginine kinase activator